MKKPKKPDFVTRHIEILSCASGNAVHDGKKRDVVVLTFRMGNNFIPLNVNVTMEQAERLVEDLQEVLKRKAPAGRKERRDARQSNREIIESLSKKG